MNRLISIVPLALLLAACAVGPDYRAPEAPAVVVRNAAAPVFVTRDPEADWWHEFGANPPNQRAGAAQDDDGRSPIQEKHAAGNGRQGTQKILDHRD